MEEIETVKGAIEAPLRERGYDLFDVKLFRDKEGLTLQIVVDREAPISLDDIVEVSELINPLLDEADPIKDPYTLDITSAGAEKPIALDKLGKYVNRHVALHLSRPHKGENLLEGDLLEVGEDTIKLAIREKSKRKEISLPRQDVDKARLAIQF